MTETAPTFDADADIVEEDGVPVRPDPRPPEPGTELARRDAPTPALFREDEHNPGATLEVAARYADVLKKVLVDRQMISRISGKEHVNIEGWQTLGTMVKVGVKVTHSGPVVNPVTGEPLVTEYEVKVKDYKWVNGQKQHVADRVYTVKGWDWQATAEARLPDGTLVGSSDAIVRRTEDRWAKADDTALLGMAQTRAMSRAYRAALGWVVHLAGYATTPAEEMPPPEPEVPAWAREATDARKKALVDSLEALVGDRTLAVGICKAMKDSIGLVPDVVVGLANGIAQTVEARKPVGENDTPGDTSAEPDAGQGEQQQQELAA